jgi:hypothetical protein
MEYPDNGSADEGSFNGVARIQQNSLEPIVEIIGLPACELPLERLEKNFESAEIIT